jgi:hypothetical protein
MTTPSAVPGLAYFHRASHALPGNAKSWQNRNPTVASRVYASQNHERRGASRILTYLNRFTRVNGELRVATINVANDPYKQSVYAIDPELERVSARIVLGADIEDLREGVR